MPMSRSRTSDGNFNPTGAHTSSSYFAACRADTCPYSQQLTLGWESTGSQGRLPALSKLASELHKRLRIYLLNVRAVYGKKPLVFMLKRLSTRATPTSETFGHCAPGITSIDYMRLANRRCSTLEGTRRLLIRVLFFWTKSMSVLRPHYVTRKFLANRCGGKSFVAWTLLGVSGAPCPLS
jgi:hypothetical protein